MFCGAFWAWLGCSFSPAGWKRTFKKLLDRVYQNKYITIVEKKKPLKPALQVKFFRTNTGSEPVRKWLKSLPPNEKRILGEDIKTVQFGWPIGMPLVKSLGGNLYETRSDIKDKIVRIIFTLLDNTMVLLHGFIKKSQKTPQKELEIAQKRLRALERGTTRK